MTPPSVTAGAGDWYLQLAWGQERVGCRQGRQQPRQQKLVGPAVRGGAFVRWRLDQSEGTRATQRPLHTTASYAEQDARDRDNTAAPRSHFTLRVVVEPYMEGDAACLQLLAYPQTTLHTPYVLQHHSASSRPWGRCTKAQAQHRHRQDTPPAPARNLEAPITATCCCCPQPAQASRKPACRAAAALAQH